MSENQTRLSLSLSEHGMLGRAFSIPLSNDLSAMRCSLNSFVGARDDPAGPWVMKL